MLLYRSVITKLNMRKIILSGSLALFLCLLTGCSVGLVRTSNPAKELQNVPRLDPNEGPVRITKSEEEPNKIVINWGWDKGWINLTKPCRVKYQTLYFDFIDLIVVPGTLPNGQTYSIWLDTGHPCHALTNGLTIIENDLPIYPLGEDPWTSAHTGLCYLPSLQIGRATITNPPCQYLQQQWEVRLLGLPIWQQKGVLLGLGLLRNFGYIVFNNVKKEAELALTGLFEPHHPGRWNSYPFSIEKAQLILDIPVEGHNLSLIFDTCGRYGMVVSQDIWEKLPTRVKTAKTKQSKFFSGFLGQLPCHRERIKKLRIGSLVVSNAEIIILPKDSPYLPAGNSISMKVFKNNVVVLDFERNLMWVNSNEPD